MIDLDVIEQRLRRTFRAVAEHPVPPAGIDAGPPITFGRPRTGRHLRILVGAVAAVVVIAAISFAVAYGPRSSGSGHTARSAEGIRAVYAPAGTPSPTVLRHEASAIAARLQVLGQSDVRVFATRGVIEVLGPRITGADLRLAGQTHTLMFRPAQCGAGPHIAGAVPGGINSNLPGCAAPYQLDTANLDVTPGSGPASGYSDNLAKVMPDPAFTSYPSTTPAHDDPAAPVLLPVDPTSGPVQYSRLVLGPAQLTGSSIAHIQTRQNGSGGWALDLTFTPDGSAQWDTFAHQYFHQLVAVDVDGSVISAPLIEPSQTSFSSFDGRTEISGNFTAAEAMGLATFLEPIPVPLVLQSVSNVSG